MDFFSREAGQRRRAWLDGVDAQATNALRYFLGPSGLDQRANALAGMAQMFADGTDYVDAYQAAGRLVSDPSVANALALVPPVVAVAMPGISNRLLEGAGSAAQDAARFVMDEDGGIRLWHGSPHDFDRFDSSKIGTGEGAQAYGHGLYFAESEGVARAYRDQLSRPYYVTADGADVAQKYGADVLDAFEAVGGDPAEIKNTISRLRGMVQRNLADYGASDVSQLQPEYAGDFASSTIDMARRADGLEALLKSGEVKRVNEGRMYEVNVDANPEDFLDWDKPLSEQPARVREALGPRVDALRQAGAGIPHDPIGEALWRVAHPQGGFDKTDFSRSVPEQAAERLRDAGIPGIRYLDGGSRGAGDGSRNYVLFRDDIISIVRKLGVAGAATALGMSAADVQAAIAEPQTARERDPDGWAQTKEYLRGLGVPVD